MHADGLTIAPLWRSIAQRCGGALPRAIAETRVDGGTTFVTRSDRYQWHPKLAELLEWILDPKTWEARDYSDGPPLVRLPLPLAPRDQSGLPGVEGARRGVLDPRHLGWASGTPTAEVHYNGGGKFFRLFFADRADVRFLRKKDPETDAITWEIHAVAKAPELYADGAEEWTRRWLGWLGWLLHGQWDMSATDMDKRWNVSNLQLNSDFVNLEILSADKWDFVGWKKSTEHARLQQLDGMAREEISKANRNATETIYFGKNTSDTEIVVYRKSVQLEKQKRVAPDSSIYAPLWLSRGWNGIDRVTRVEFRLRKKALQYFRTIDGKRELYVDLRKPSTLLDPEAMRHAWQHVALKRRLACPRDAKSRLTRSPMDPAWAAVVRLSGTIDVPADMRQTSREVRENTRRERLAKDLHKLTQSAIDVACRHGAALESYEDVGAVLEWAGKKIREEGMPAEFSALPNVRDIRVKGEYAALTSAFFAGEAEAAFTDFAAGVGVPLDRVDWERVSDHVTLGDSESFSRGLARSTAKSLRAWTCTALTEPKSPTLPPAFRAGAMFGLEDALEHQGAPPRVLKAFDLFRRMTRFQGERTPRTEEDDTMNNKDENNMTQEDMGDQQGFPHHLSPHTACGVREWMFISLTAGDEKEASAAGVPPAFRRGVVLGFQDALGKALPMARELEQPSLVAAIETMLEFVALTGVTPDKGGE